MAGHTGEGTRLTDVTGMEHVLTRRISDHTGFGDIWRTQEPRTLVKVFRREGRGIVADQLLARLRLLPLDGLSVVQPVSALRAPSSGYVMRGVFGGQTWHDFEADVGERPDMAWIQAQVRLAEVLATLHARSLVFGDLNPRNVLLAPDGGDAVLIDLDTVVREGVEFEEEYLNARVPKYVPPGFDGRRAFACEDVWTWARVLQDCWEAHRRPPLDGVLPRTYPSLIRLTGVSDLAAANLPTAHRLWQSLALDADAVLCCPVCRVLTHSASCPTCGRRLWDATIEVGRRASIRCTTGVWRSLHRRHAQVGPETGADWSIGRIQAAADGVTADIDGRRYRFPFGSPTILETAEGSLRVRPERAARR